MGLEDADRVDYGDAAGRGKAASSVSCSICLEDVTDYGDRAWAKLHCGHQFHLDCIGCAFNAKGVMQCPNCRKIEKGQWLYADGGRELTIDDFVNDEDVYDLTLSESSIWCPYGAFTQLSAAFDEVEFPTTVYHDIGGQQQHNEHAASSTSISSHSHMCPYIAYFPPLSTTQGPISYNNNNNNNSNNQWNTQSVSNEIPNSYYNTLFPTPTTTHHHPGMPPRTNADMSRSGPPYAHPLFPTQSSGSRPPSSSMTRPFPGSGPRAGAGAGDPYFQQRFLIGTGAQRSNGQLQVGPPSDQTHGGVYYSGRSFQESESSMLNLVHHIWERDLLPRQHPVERVPFHLGFRQQHGSQRMPSHSQYRL